MGGQGSYFRSLDHLGRSSETKDRKKKKCVTDGRTRLDGGTDGSTDKGAAYERLKSAKKKREEGVEVYDINKVVDKA